MQARILSHSFYLSNFSARGEVEGEGEALLDNDWENWSRWPWAGELEKVIMILDCNTMSVVRWLNPSSLRKEWVLTNNVGWGARTERENICEELHKQPREILALELGVSGVGWSQRFNHLMKGATQMRAEANQRYKLCCKYAERGWIRLGQDVVRSKILWLW